MSPDATPIQKIDFCLDAGGSALLHSEKVAIERLPRDNTFFPTSHDPSSSRIQYWKGRKKRRIESNNKMSLLGISIVPQMHEIAAQFETTLLCCCMWVELSPQENPCG